jgi:hypothetical protein
MRYLPRILPLRAAGHSAPAARRMEKVQLLRMYAELHIRIYVLK